MAISSNSEKDKKIIVATDNSEYLHIYEREASKITSASAEILKSLTDPTGSYQVGIAKDSYRKEIEYLQGRLIPIQIYFQCKKENILAI